MSHRYVYKQVLGEPSRVGPSRHASPTSASSSKESTSSHYPTTRQEGVAAQEALPQSPERYCHDATPVHEVSLMITSPSYCPHFYPQGLL